MVIADAAQVMQSSDIVYHGFINWTKIFPLIPAEAQTSIFGASTAI